MINIDSGAIVLLITPTILIPIGGYIEDDETALDAGGTQPLGIAAEKVRVFCGRHSEKTRFELTWIASERGNCVICKNKFGVGAAWCSGVWQCSSRGHEFCDGCFAAGNHQLSK